MQFPESWLRTLVNPPIATDELAHRLTMAGLEVEDTVPAAPAFSGVVVARIVEIAPHPDADKLRVCQVDDGSGERLQIVCGAPNAAAGLTVPLARVGAELPGGMKIGVAKMRGVQSSGMLCSARELGLSQDHAGLLELPAEMTPGQSIREALDLDDTLFTLKMTPNRADCLSILGVAREVAALTGAPLSVPTAAAVPVTLDERLPVKVEAPDLCGRFGGRVIRGVNARAATPDWMKTRLERAGQRSLSALVDISNYVMLELGRPSHVFDLDKIQGDLCVRWAREGETLELLNGQTVTLDPRVGVVAAGDQVESLAGIMGGEATSVTLDTQNIYLEAAFWWPESLAGRARRYKFSSEASHRGERGVDFATIPQHIEFITRLIVDICGGQVGPLDDQIVNLPKREPVRMRLARCHRVLGVPVTQAEVAKIFGSLGLEYAIEGDEFIVTPPSYRFDLELEEDLIEEVARIYGFENIPAVPPMARAKMYSQPEIRRGAHFLRRLTAAQDYQEVVNYSFVEADWERDYAGNETPVRLVNPIASHLSVMRSSLIGGLVANIRHNANRKQSRVRVFELGRVFMRDASAQDGPLEVAGVRQPLKLAGAAWGPAVEEQWGVATRHVDFYDVKMDVEALFGARGSRLRFAAAAHPALHPGRSARVELDGRQVGWIGELHPRWAQQADLAHAPVVFELDVTALSEGELPQVRELSRQPVVVRDLALWVDEGVSVQSMLDTVAAAVKADPQLAVVQDAQLFDVWREKPQHGEPATEKSLAFRFWLQDTEVTLDEARVADCLARIKDALVAAHGARQRA
ncbi:phenylalanine--tRNA ligase subunit beta [Achromobacter denitrificans]|uniref:Phenylalanine--tRNA ligase beta subunit n=1 Tax=Achromobacter denitrificans TaxID=32002 RepID=A0ABZ3G8T1_ACHDE|nr:phenylalanine--tRNA ligase subunit beta [Achromobacter denitrificans]MDX3879408.1 phenylalanine--tRNA ligase subunit beta [Achromobacter sp.]ASC68531.1 phenylalanine--tRNA ligase subunit beta [Achromobacter denitrificans]MBV2159880.1 phenylalanine--tRNA ligase subunit beta [Achromobacter denitrificans]MDF3847772.1 phenylalanine--tRNA ligase subunit beta [Achromobacter denitrificans]MDF3943898.1 phenylalanine--tRNA ligase subunit beta [Achromobacter denitrificans]